ncbi:hypothetical protein PsYK624_087770 [Phanerochaete sordida]|uniref:Uncharacterized protein n=1 Tax=Phanerochaete sordida TaxID=48140 RepID=A0A9P3LG20_9APHY|nr:hypothetical protein PsYK624_087770 [Phanerochaete sordida]
MQRTLKFLRARAAEEREYAVHFFVPADTQRTRRETLKKAAEERTKQAAAEKKRKEAAEHAARVGAEKKRRRAEQTRRDAEVEGMRRRMEEMRVQEAADRAARAKKQRAAPEPPQMTGEEQTRRRHAHAAAASERRRYAERNRGWAPWTDEQHVAWFIAMGAEFDSAKFDAARPLVVEAVPWPLLLPPDQHTLDTVEWDAVERFFAAAKGVLDGEVYQRMVVSAHRRFHPDRWKSRGLLNTVLDEDLKQRLEEAGNVVCQAITPIWRAVKSA